MWAKSGSILKRTCWTMEDATATVAGRPVENLERLNLCMPRSFPADLEPPTKSVEDVLRCKDKGQGLLSLGQVD